MYLFSFLTQSPIVCTPVPCLHPHLLHPHVDSCHSYRYPLASVPIVHVSLWPCGSILYKWFSDFVVFPQFNYHKSLSLLNVTLRTLHFNLVHSMRSLMLACLPITWFIIFQPRHPLVTVCVLFLDLVVTLAKSYLVLIFSVEDTPIWVCSLSWQSSLRALFFLRSKTEDSVFDKKDSLIDEANYLKQKTR